MNKKMSNKQRESDTSKSFIRLKNEVGSEDIYYSVFYEGIPKEFKDLSWEELNETEENKRMGLLKLKDFLKGKGISGVEDHTLITVLRSCKYNIEKSEKKVMKMLETVDMITKCLQTADLKRIEAVLNHNIVGFLPYRDKHGRTVVFTNPYDIDFEQFDMDDIMLCTFCTFLYVLTFPLTSVAGFAYIAECKTPDLSILYPVVKSFKHSIRTVLSFPLRIGRVDVINENFIIRWGYKLTKPLIPSKIIQRVDFHGSDLQSLQDFHHPATLPEEFGGTMGPISSKFFAEDLLNFIKELKSRNLYL